MGLLRRRRRPGTDDVVGRALCLGVFVLRGKLEEDVREGRLGSGNADRVMRSLGEQLLEPRLRGRASAAERRRFGERPGSWHEQDVVDASWRTETLGVLLWAVGVVEELPGYDTTFEPAAVLDPLELPGPADEFAARAALRPLAEIDAARDTAELWHWRARTTQLQRAPATELPPGADLAEIVAAAARLASERGIIPPPVADDFPAFGKAYGRLSEPEYQRAMSLASERHLALNWLCGYSRDWDSTPTET